MTTIHLILHAHIDPIWLWQWQTGLDIQLATWRSACDLLDRHPDLVFPADSAWAYGAVEKIDPALLNRIQRHVEAGRWEPVGGWWVQPDCNLPLGDSFRRQIELGREELVARFGRFPRVAFNPDSFGHSAALPAILRAAGQDCYVMLRPKPVEMPLPARLFRWAGHAGGPEVLTFRIANEYQVRPPMEKAINHLHAALTELPPGVTHTMCFIGVGDHGGGVTEQTVRWCKDNPNAIEGARLVFSSPARFFNAVADQLHRVPLVIGELQQHAVGCYSVHRPIKTRLRRAEHLLRQAAIAIEHARPGADPNEQLREAWQRVCFHQFHDTLGGTCIPSAYEQVQNEVGLALARAEEALHFSLRQAANALPDDTAHRVVVFNASDQSFEGLIEFEPWREYAVSLPYDRTRLLDSDGQVVPYQRLQPEAQTGCVQRFLVPMCLAAGEMRALRIMAGETAVEPVPTALVSNSHVLRNGRGGEIRLTETGGLMFESFAGQLPLPQLHLLDDPTDTWSHEIDRYPETPVELATWDAPRLAEDGPLRKTLVRQGRIGQSLLRAHWSVFADSDELGLVLEIDWRERQKVLKMVIEPPVAIHTRFDGISDGDLHRPGDGRELPLRDRTLLCLADGRRLGLVCPDVFAIDGTAKRVRLTLLRAAVMAHQLPHRGDMPGRRLSDNGLETFRFRFIAARELTGDRLDHSAVMLQRPPVFADLTRGMPLNVDQGFYNPQFIAVP